MDRARPLPSHPAWGGSLICHDLVKVCHCNKTHPVAPTFPLHSQLLSYQSFVTCCETGFFFHFAPLITWECGHLESIFTSELGQGRAKLSHLKVHSVGRMETQLGSCDKTQYSAYREGVQRCATYRTIKVEKRESCHCPVTVTEGQIMKVCA